MKALTATILGLLISGPAWAGGCDNDSFVKDIDEKTKLATRQWDGHIWIGNQKQNCRRSSVRGKHTWIMFTIRCKYQGDLVKIGNPLGNAGYAGYIHFSGAKDSHGRCILSPDKDWYFNYPADTTNYKASGRWDRKANTLRIDLSNGVTLRLWQVLI